MRFFAWMAVVAFVARSAVADELTVPTAWVQTRDGTIYEGQVVEYVEGDHVSLWLKSGTVTRLPYRDIYELRPSPLTALPPRGDRKEQRFNVSLNTDRPRTELQRRVDEGFYEKVCMAPCEDTIVSPDTYRLAGPRLVPTPDFTLTSGQNHIVANMGSTAGGIALLGVGVPFIVISVFMVAGGAAMHCYDSYYDSSCSRGVVIGSGVVTGVIGIVMTMAGGIILKNARSIASINGQIAYQGWTF